MFVKTNQGWFDKAPAREWPGLLFYTLVLFLRFFLVFPAVVAVANCFAFAATLVFAVLLLTVRLVAALMGERARLV